LRLQNEEKAKARSADGISFHGSFNFSAKCRPLVNVQREEPYEVA